MEADDTLSRSIYQLLRREPFYAHILANVTRVLTDDVPTMAVSFREEVFYLYVNPHFLLHELNPGERVAVLKHEVLHLIFKHLLRVKGKHPKIENIAADLVVNQYITPWNLPKGAILLSTFPELALDPMESMEYYYNQLLKLLEEGAEAQYPESCKALGTLQHEPWGIGIHDAWGEDGSEVAERKLKGILNEAKQKSSAFGSLPYDIQRAINEWLAAPKISWKQVLRLFTSSCGRTAIKTTRRKESKRFEGNPGRRIKRLRRMVVAIDTSGSVDEKLLGEFWTEIMAIYTTGSEVTVLECDAKIQAVYDVRRTGTVPTMKGGGGTRFDPVIAWANSARGYNGLIYFTDGYASKPPPCKLPLLWCVYGDIQQTDHLKGKIIRVGNAQQEPFSF